jgi:branched-chain amino acid transport system ATP-binding protein
MSPALPDAPPLLDVRGVSKRYGSLVVVDDLSFTVAPGEALGVVGPNGAGKTTMLNLVSGTAAVDGGAVLLDGTDVTRTSAAHRCRTGIGRTYQVPRPFGDMTVFENVLVGAVFGGGLSRQAGYDAARDALEVSGLLPVAGVRAGTLRLLDRKRLELARALATGPRLVLLDEIAGGLTDAELPELIETVQGVLARGVAVVWIEHIVHALLAVVDRLMCLTYGRLLAIGEPREVLRSPEVVEVYLGRTAEAVA